MMESRLSSASQGILLVDKEKGVSSFRLVSILRKVTGIQKIGHSGTLDPFATGLMVMLIGREFTKRSNEFLETEKEYEAVLHLGIATDTYDPEGTVSSCCDRIPALQELRQVFELFQGEIFQVPPMYSAKKVQGKKLYDLARSGITIDRQPVQVRVKITLLSYLYPEAHMHVVCSKGTYVRSLAHDIGQALGVGGHLTSLTRLRSGTFRLEAAVAQAHLQSPGFDITHYLL
jgi:tRNA pseudouridine55 synthase